MADESTDQQRKNSDGRKRRLANLRPFPKGRSGNPAGRPKSLTLSEAFRRQLSQPVPNDEHGRTFAEVVAERMCLAAAGGDVGAAREIADRTEGKARQAISMDMNVTDWRQMAQASGLNEQDVLREAQRLIESATDSSGE
jgi:hypothetical protein